MRAKFVFFDLGNVLVYFDHEIAVNQLAQLLDRPADAVREVVFKSGLQNRYETGLVTSSEYAAIINRELQSKAPPDEILEAISAIFQRNESILDALSFLRASNTAMGVLSNTCHAHWQWLERQRWPMLGDWFGTRVLSFEVGSMKPDPHIYQVCEQAIGLKGSQIFFMDDREENVVAALQRGWIAHRYCRTDKLLEKLCAWVRDDDLPLKKS